METSRLAGFHKSSLAERLSRLGALCDLDQSQLDHLADTGNLAPALADRLIENVIGTMALPLGLATNMIVDGREILIPMATEESSVVAAVCNAARLCRSSGGFQTSISSGEMIAQIQLLEVSLPDLARQQILEKTHEIKAACDQVDPLLCKLGGGFRDLEVRILDTRSGPMVITHLIVDCRDAMGANAVNSMAEAVAPLIAGWTGGRTLLRILSNLADRRLARAKASWPVDTIGGAGVRDDIIAAAHFAEADPYRAATHNKGIMNGIDAVALATGNDTRALEAGAHAYAARHGRYAPLSRWQVDPDGNLEGNLELPLAMGLVGGATKAHPTAQIALAILGVEDAAALARVTVAIGLAQNFAALNALATTGIQQGHMALHAQNMALMAGAEGSEIDQVAERLVVEGRVRLDFAEDFLKDLRTKD